MKYICVFCGGNLPPNSTYKRQAQKLVQLMVKNNIGLVFGGGRIGLMGVIADEMIKQGGKVIGVIPKLLEQKEMAHDGLTELHVVSSMHERKKRMFDLSDGFISLPGGFGTLDETFEILTWIQIGIHQKPMVWLNSNGYYDRLIAFIEKACKVGFVRKEHKKYVQVAKTPQKALQTILKAWQNKK